MILMKTHGRVYDSENLSVVHGWSQFLANDAHAAKVGGDINTVTLGFGPGRIQALLADGICINSSNKTAVSSIPAGSCLAAADAIVWRTDSENQARLYSNGFAFRSDQQIRNNCTRPCCLTAVGCKALGVAGWNRFLKCLGGAARVA